MTSGVFQAAGSRVLAVGTRRASAQHDHWRDRQWDRSVLRSLAVSALLLPVYSSSSMVRKFDVKKIRVSILAEI